MKRLFIQFHTLDDRGVLFSLSFRRVEYAWFFELRINLILRSYCFHFGMSDTEKQLQYAQNIKKFTQLLETQRK